MVRSFFLSTVLMLAGMSAFGQTPMIGQDPRGAAMLNASGVIPASCAACNTPPLDPSTQSPGIFRCRNCNGNGCALCDAGCGGCGELGCVPGRAPCVTCEGQSQLGRLFCAFHNAIACPDPCYEPRWVDGANASFFTDSARPWTMSRVRWDSAYSVLGADRAELFMASMGAGRKGFPGVDTTAKYDEFNFYQEFANGGFSAFTEMRFRNYRGNVNNGSGFGDMAIGTKSMFLDSELLTMSFQMRTVLPTGSASSGVGTGHVTIEPSLLNTMKLCTDTYLQSQIGLSVPIAGTGGHAATVLLYRGSLNHVICRPLADTALIGTFELSGYNFAGGLVTLPAGRVSANANIMSIGPGLRLAISNRVDAGAGVLFNVTSTRLEETLVRTELRWRY